MRLTRLAALGALLALACAGPPPMVVSRTYALEAGAVAKVAVVPFYPARDLEHSTRPGSVGHAEAADLVARFVTEALVAGGVRTVAPSDLVIAFEGRGQVLPRGDVAALAEVAAHDFGASAVLLGRVMRYREREGSAVGALHPASVAFAVDLYTAPGGEHVFSARFDQTQPALSSAPMVARQYPGGGMRWLSAAELARFGGDRMVAALPEGLR